MALTALDPRTALIVIDLQKGIVNIPAAHPMTEVISRASALTDACRRHGLPIVLVNVTGGAPGRTEQPRPGGEFPADWAELIPELQAQANDHRVSKQTWGAFTRTDLEAHLRSLGVTQLIMAGVATSIGVESTARQAHELGYHVTLATDAMTDRSMAAHNHSITSIFPRLSETGTTQEIIDLLDSTRT
jgi:nicotinamidase-related amidase